jgi:hypothetical protein
VQGGPDHDPGGTGVGFLFLPNGASSATSAYYNQLATVLTDTYQLSGTVNPSTLTPAAAPTLSANTTDAGQTSTAATDAAARATTQANTMSSADRVVATATRAAARNTETVATAVTDVVRQVDKSATALGGREQVDQPMYSIMNWALQHCHDIVTQATKNNEAQAKKVNLEILHLTLELT